MVVTAKKRDSKNTNCLYSTEVTYSLKGLEASLRRLRTADLVHGQLLSSM